MEEWLKFTGQDGQAYGAIAVFSFLLHRWKRCPDELALFGPTLLGMAYGISDGLNAGYGLVSHAVFKGALVCGAGATLSARALHGIIEKYWGNGSIATPPDGAGG